MRRRKNSLFYLQRRFRLISKILEEEQAQVLIDIIQKIQTLHGDRATALLTESQAEVDQQKRTQKLRRVVLEHFQDEYTTPRYIWEGPQRPFLRNLTDIAQLIRQNPCLYKDSKTIELIFSKSIALKPTSLEYQCALHGKTIF